MIFPPHSFKPGPWAPHNGDASRSTHARAIDEYATWLAAVRRHPIPVPLGRALVDGYVYELRVLLPAYVEYCAVGLLCTGWGSVTLTCSDDAYSVVVPVGLSDGTTASHDLSNADWVWAQDRLPSASADGLWRAIEITDQASPHEVDLTVALTDHSGTNLLKVHQVLILPLPRLEDSQLP